MRQGVRILYLEKKYARTRDYDFLRALILYLKNIVYETGVRFDIGIKF